MVITVRDRLMVTRNTKQFIDILIEVFNYKKSKNNGGHLILRTSGMPPLSIPYHKEISPGVRRYLVNILEGKRRCDHYDVE